MEALDPAPRRSRGDRRLDLSRVIRAAAETTARLDPRARAPRWQRRGAATAQQAATPAATGRRLVYLCDWLPPDFGAVGQYSLGFARAYARDGRDVVLVGLSSRGPSRVVEEHDATGGRLTVVRVAAAPYTKERWRERLRWTL